VSYLYENQGIDFDDVRAAIKRLFGPEHTVTIHDGDGTVLFGRVDGGYCAGTVTAPSGATVATFAIDYTSDETPGGDVVRHVTGVHLGPCGQWCRSVADGDRFDRWVDFIGERYAVEHRLRGTDLKIR
jgi:hypothetical protein